MPDTTYEEASRCPKCQRVGNLATKKRVSPDAGGGWAHMFECATPVCLWFGTQYIIQVRDDGTIPNRETDIPTLRAYPAMPEYLKAVAQRTIEDIKYKGRHMTDKEIQEEIDRETDSR